MLDIGEVARRAGVAPSTLRYYEELGLLSSSTRAGGRRQYHESVLRRLEVIAFAKETGFTLAEIGELLSGPGHATARRHALTRRKLDEVNAHIARAEAMRSMLEASLTCDCADLEACPAVTGC
jgi:DNA-binding transcriptional MerR regulator